MLCCNLLRVSWFFVMNSNVAVIKLDAKTDVCFLLTSLSVYLREFDKIKIIAKMPENANVRRHTLTLSAEFG